MGDERQIKNAPTKDENREGHVFIMGRREKIMKKLIKKVREMNEIPAWVQSIIDEFEDPDREPDYVIMQRREQYAEKIEKAEGSETKSAVLVGPQSVVANVGSTRM